MKYRAVSDYPPKYVRGETYTDADDVCLAAGILVPINEPKKPKGKPSGVKDGDDG